MKVFHALHQFCSPGEPRENITYWHSGNTRESFSGHADSSSKQGRPRLLHPKELFITLCRLREEIPEVHLANLYSVS